MRIRSAAALGLVAVAAASCGGGGGSSDPVTGVRQTLHQFASDVASGDYAGACSKFTSSAISSLGGESNCEKLLKLAASVPNAKQKIQQQASLIDSTPVSVSGNTATVRFGNSPTTFTNQDGRWLINSGVSR